jgi:hypothetical protein
MKKIYLLLSLSLIVLLTTGQEPIADLDTVYAGPHSRSYNVELTRGYYFQAQSSFVITELMCAEDANPAATNQSVMIVSYGETEPAHWTSTTLSPYTTLFSAINAPAGWIDCNIVIEEGNYYGIVGAVHDEGSTIMNNSYGERDLVVEIEGFSTTLVKLAYQASMAEGVAPSGSFGAEPGGEIGRIHLITSATPIVVPDCPESIVVDNDPGACGAVVNYPAPTAEGATVTQIDNSGFTSGDEFPVGTTVQQYEFDYGAGFLDTCTFNVTVNDVEPPVFTCPEDIVAFNDPGETCAVVNFPNLGTITGGEAEPGITLPNAPTNQAGVAYNPDKKLYYAVQAGSSSYTLYTYDETGTEVASNTANFDFRGLWWNPNTSSLEGSSHSGDGYRVVDLDANGYALSTGTNDPATNYQPDVQSQADYDYNLDEVIYYFNNESSLKTY